MITKIVSGGQTGADRAALDTAIKFNIDHGGWVPRGRKAEDGPIQEIYRLQEMDTDSYPKRTEQNVRDSGGTVIFSRGALTGGSLLTWNVAARVKKPCIHIDLLEVDEFEAAMILDSFVTDARIQVLNVAGSRHSNDPLIYASVRSILETFLYLDMMHSDADEIPGQDLVLMERKATRMAATVDEAVTVLAEALRLRTRSLIANARSEDIASIYFSMADVIRVRLGLDVGNDRLMAACAIAAGKAEIEVEDAVMMILKALKAFLEKNHVLRVIR